MRLGLCFSVKASLKPQWFKIIKIYLLRSFLTVWHIDGLASQSQKDSNQIKILRHASCLIWITQSPSQHSREEHPDTYSPASHCLSLEVMCSNVTSISLVRMSHMVLLNCSETRKWEKQLVAILCVSLLQLLIQAHVHGLINFFTHQKW